MNIYQQHDLAKKVIYLFQRLGMLGLIVLLLWMEREWFALVFCLFYWNRPEYDRIRKVITREVTSARPSADEKPDKPT